MSRFIWTFLLSMSFPACRGEEPVIPDALPLASSSENAALSKPELLDTLPDSIRNAITDCRTAGKFYDLRTLACDAAEFPTFSCALGEPLRAAISVNARQELDSYLATIDPDLRLYDCTVESGTIFIHFYKFQDQRIRYSILKLAPL